MPGSRTLPIYISAGSIFAALAVRNFTVPLRVHELGGDKIAVGLLFSVFTVTAAGLSLPAGFLADRFGKRALVIFAVLTGGVSQVGMAAATTVAPMFVWQAVAGLGGGAAQAALFSALAEAVPGPRLGRAMGWLTLAMQLGFLAGPALAALALGYVDLQVTLGASAVLFGVALGAAAVGIRGGGDPGRGWNLGGPLADIGRQRGFLAVCVGLLGATLLWGTLQAYLPLYGIERMRLPQAQIGYMIAIQAVANGLSRIPGGRLVDRAARKGPIVIGGVVAYSLAIALLPHLGSFWAVTALLALSVPLLATTYIAISVVFSNLAGDATRGVAMGVYGAVLYIGLGAGPAVFGTIMERAGYTAGFTACALTGLVLAGAVALLRSEPLRRLRPAPGLPPGSPGT